MEKRMMPIEVKSGNGVIVLTQHSGYDADHDQQIHLCPEQAELLCKWILEAKAESEEATGGYLDRDEQELEFLDREQTERLNGYHPN